MMYPTRRLEPRVGAPGRRRAPTAGRYRSPPSGTRQLRCGPRRNRSPPSPSEMLEETLAPFPATGCLATQPPGLPPAARATTGHAAALPSPAMNVRRRMDDPPRLVGETIAIRDA